MALKDVIGQDKAIRMLASAARRGRLASSYLFQGDSGIGKRFTALNFLKALYCLSPEVYGLMKDACEKCPSCRKLNSGIHPDFLSVCPEEGEIKIDVVRAVGEWLSLRPHEARMKAVLVDEAETLNGPASNAFLKTLEEPPMGSIIILVTESPDRLTETIRSRCLRINFVPLGKEDCMRVLAGEKEAHAGLSMGRPGLILKEDFIGRRKAFLKTLGTISGPRTKGPWTSRGDVENWLDTALLFLRDMAVLKTGGAEARLINEDLRAKFELMGNNADLKVIIESYGRLSYLRRHTGFNLNKSITWNSAVSVLRRLDIKWKESDG